MGFTFRFASVLKLRRHEEKMEKQKMAVLMKKKAGLDHQIHELELKCRQETAESDSESVITNRQRYAQKHARHKRLMRLGNERTQLEVEIEGQRQKLAEANKKTRMMEKLKKNEKRAFIQRVEHYEQLQQNEIALQRYNKDY